MFALLSYTRAANPRWDEKGCRQHLPPISATSATTRTVNTSVCREMLTLCWQSLISLILLLGWVFLNHLVFSWRSLLYTRCPCTLWKDQHEQHKLLNAMILIINIIIEWTEPKVSKWGLTRGTSTHRAISSHHLCKSTTYWHIYTTLLLQATSWRANPTCADASGTQVVLTSLF